MIFTRKRTLSKTKNEIELEDQSSPRIPDPKFNMLDKKNNIFQNYMSNSEALSPKNDINDLK